MRLSASIVVSVLLIALGNTLTHAGGNLHAGSKIYELRCVSCHGDKGKGDSRMEGMLNPKPRKHSDGFYMNRLSHEHLVKVIKKGGGAVGKSPMMPGNPDLNDQELEDLIAFLRSLAVPQFPSGGDAVEGNKMYQIRCKHCHGENGKGDSATMKGTLTPPAQDHTNGDYMNRLSHEYLAKVIKEGGKAVGKSPMMPGNPDLSVQELDDLIAFLRSLAAPPHRGK